MYFRKNEGGKRLSHLLKIRKKIFEVMAITLVNTDCFEILKCLEIVLETLKTVLAKTRFS